jgi:hypothetical protein
MSACFVYELGKVGAFYYDTDTRVAVIGVLSESANSIGKFDVCGGNDFASEKSRVHSALSGFNFDNAFHHVLL